ncbi:MAG: MarR family transcriptional regulator [Ignavibacteriaceae bacterium]
MGTRYKGSKSETTILDTYIKLYRATEKIKSGIFPVLHDHKISETQFYILDALYNLGPKHQKELAEKVLKSGGNITMVIDNLEKTQLVSRTRGKSDRRVYRVSITPKGKKLYEKIFPDFLNYLVKEFSPLTSKELNELSRISKKLGLTV